MVTKSYKIYGTVKEEFKNLNYYECEGNTDIKANVCFIFSEIHGGEDDYFIALITAKEEKHCAASLMMFLADGVIESRRGELWETGMIGWGEGAMSEWREEKTIF